jgi:TrmH family RNA methyltransferase
VALSGVGNPGNIGAVMRTCDAVGCAGLILLGDTADPYHPDAVRASRGTAFALCLVRASLPELVAWKRTHRVNVLGTSPTAATDYRGVRYPRPLLLLMGSERGGLSPAARALCDQLVRVPMVGRADSLNLAVATGVVLYELFYQHRAGAAREE